jgi:23S rRNA (adenine2030-N6)-methyltransferase
MYAFPYVHDDYAGGLEDIVVHLLLSLAIKSRSSDGRRVMYVDTHAGAGLYRLIHTKKSHREMINLSSSRLYQQGSRNLYLANFLSVIKRANNYSRHLRTYPGSPAIARALLPQNRSLILSERDPSVYRRLRRWANNRADTVIHNSDGFGVASEIFAQLAPDRDYVFFVDPAYEVLRGKVPDYDRVVGLLLKASHLPTNVMICVTYPAATEGDFVNLRSALDRLPPQVYSNLLCSDLRFYSPRAALRGAGLLLANAPDNYKIKARSALFMLAETLHLKGARTQVWRPSRTG